tara:strand:- start:794 stop:1525 length:732 start_codon:yes stop_codon:yes gene_type:complete
MKILIIGESCKDIFHYGECKRLCPEAPVPVFNSIQTVDSGGMAMNVFNNVKIFGHHPEILTNENWREIKKTRFVEQRSNHMFMRLDENDGDFKRSNLKSIEFDKYDAIIVSDYDKGFLTPNDLKYISSKHNLTFLDTKKVLGDWCKGFAFIKINGVEYQRTKHTIDEQMRQRMIITYGPKGCYYQGKQYKVPMVEIKDTSGAGDTFIAALCYEFCKSSDIDRAIIFANECSTKVVQKRGVSTT